MWPDSAQDNCKTLSEREKEEVREQLDRLLASHHLNQSQRSVTFLRFIINHALEGDEENLKERTLGIEVFHRGADYDTASDPVVRVTASGLRKRIAQYYQDPGHENEVRIILPSGSYVPNFHWPSDSNEAGVPDLELAAEESAVQVDEGLVPRAQRERHRLVLKISAACILTALLVAGAIIWHTTSRSGFNFFWGPILMGRDPVLVCIADQLQDAGIALRNPAAPDDEMWFKDDTKKNAYTTIAIDDMSAATRIAAVFQASGKKYALKGERATTLDDLRSGPAILIGAFDNAWTLRVTKSLRFHFLLGDGHLLIVDGTASTQPQWVADQYRDVQMGASNYRDYAIVARFTDENTGKIAVVVAGLGRCGTAAAGEFLTDTGDLLQLERAAKSAGNKQNLEVVISTQVIGGRPGSPKMEAIHFW